MTNGGDPPTSETAQQTLPIDIYTAATIPNADFEACFKLIEMSSSNDYSGSGMGWSPVKKRKEMRLPDMRYLVLRGGGERGRKGEERDSGTEEDGDMDVMGFLSFMVTYEDAKEVIYCYEIHLAPPAQGMGLGKELMMRYEEIGRRVGLEKAMLTVFKSNARALRFYEKMGYVVDEFSPSPRTLRNGTVKEPEYLILSKGLKGPVGNGDGTEDQ